MNKRAVEREYIGADGEVRELDDAFFRKATRGRPPMRPDERKQRVTMYLDRDIVEHFKREGRGWQTRVNEVLSEVVADRTGKRGKSPSGKRA